MNEFWIKDVLCDLAKCAGNAKDESLRKAILNIIDVEFSIKKDSPRSQKQTGTPASNIVRSENSNVIYAAKLFPGFRKPITSNVPIRATEP